MLLPDNRECSARRPGAIRKEIHRGLHDVPVTERVRVYDLSPFAGMAEGLNRFTQIEMRRGAGRAHYGIHGKRA